MQQDIITQQELMEQLQKCIKMLRKNGTELAKAEYEYKTALNKKALELREIEGMPVTLINQIIYGESKVANLRLLRDIAKVTYEANLEAINSYKLQLRLNDNQISREWHG